MNKLNKKLMATAVISALQSEAFFSQPGFANRFRPKEARVRGPLLSLEAHGQVDKSVVFVLSRGIQLVRTYRIPNNPQSPTQGQARSVLVVGGGGVSRIGDNQLGKADAALLTPFEFLLTIRMSGDVWNSVFYRRGYPGGALTLTGDVTAWAALDASQLAAWATFNTALPNSLPTVIAAPGDTRPFVADFVCFSVIRALARCGYLPSVPSTDPPTWDNALRARTVRKWERRVIPAVAA